LAAPGAGAEPALAAASVAYDESEDATVPFGRKAEFLRKRIPGAEGVALGDYLKG
jgi:hypothetical protein